MKPSTNEGQTDYHLSDTKMIYDLQTTRLVVGLSKSWDSKKILVNLATELLSPDALAVCDLH